MLNFGPTFIWTIINLIALYLILKKMFFKRVTEFMENRVNSIKADIDNAEKARVEAEELKRRRDELLKAARQEADSIISSARDKAEEQSRQLVEAARAQSEQLLAKAREEIELERQQMLQRVKSDVAGLALAAATKVIEANMDNERNRALVDKFIDEAGAA